MTDLWDDDEDFEDSKPKGKNPLRDVVKDLEAKLKERDEELKALRPKVRKTEVSSVLTKLNVNPKIAGLVPSDVEATEDSIKAWVEEYGDIFGATTVEGSTTDTAPSDNGSTGAGEIDPTLAAQAAQWQRIQTQASATGTTSPDIETQQIAMLQAAEKAAGGNTDVLFAMLRGDTPIPAS